MNSDESQTRKQEPETAFDPWKDSEEETAKVDLVEEPPENKTAEWEAGVAELQRQQAAEVLENSEEKITEIELGTQPPAENKTTELDELEKRVAELRRQEQTLKQQIAALQGSYTQQMGEMQAAMGRLIQEGLREFEQRRQTLQISVEQLERRQERIRNEMKTTFAGVSQDLAIRVQGFKDYLVGSLQDLAGAAEQLDLVPKAPEPEMVEVKEAKAASAKESPVAPQFADQGFQDQARQIRKLLDQYRTRPDYYGPPWQLRRTFEPVHAERASQWFFTQGGKGASRTLGTRLQNILVASSIISVLRALYGDRLRTLILANSPERLGEWRRGLQDCLGISRGDFGPTAGLILFEAPEPLAIKAERLVKEGEMPLIIIDETEGQVSLSVLQFPLWLAFAPDPQSPSYSYDRS